MQVMVAEDRDGAVSERDQVAQRGKGLRAAIDDVAGEPQRRGIARGGFCQQTLKCFAATLDVAECEWDVRLDRILRK